MQEHDSLHSRFKADVFSVSSVVVLVAAVFALAGAYATQAWTGGDVTVAFGVLIGIGIGVPTLYREWSANLSVSAAFLWTAIVSAMAYGFYAFVFVFATRLGASADFGGFLALGLTASFGIAFSLHRTRIA
jgi:hypothetical protein